MRFLLSFALIFYSFFVQSQRSDFSLIYELSNTAYEEKVRTNTFELTPKDCQILVGSTDTLNWKNHPSGYYIEAKAVGEQLQLSILDRTSIHAVLLNNERDFAVQIVDTLGQLVTPAQVWLNSKKVKYDEQTKSYRLSKRKRGGMLKVEAAGQVLIYQIDNRKLRNSYSHFSSSLFGYIVTTPIRLGRGIYRYFRNGFDYGNWIPYVHLPSIRFRQKKLKGYIATNQPIYRHGDTLKIKAYVAKENGKLWKDELELEISTYNQKNRETQIVSSITLVPDENGNVIQDIHLADSLLLDQQYSISLNTYNKIRNYNSLSHYFKLEDYQLNEVSYEFSTEKEEYKLDKKVVISAAGKDQNGLFIADGNVKIIAITKAVISIHDTAIYIPDTLWMMEQALSSRTATQLIFPDSLLPNAEMQIQLQAYFTNSNGELQKKEKTIRYGSNIDRYELKLENGQMLVSHFLGANTIKDSIILVTQFDQQQHNKKIQLPHQEKLNAYANSYQIKDNKGRTIIILSYPYTASVECNGSYLKDSVQFQISNPNRIPINYWIYRAKELIETGQTETNFAWSRLDENHRTYHVKYQYVWSGKSKQSSQSIQHYENKLRIEVEEPDKVVPGEQTQIKVKVSDSKENTTPNVNLTAAAINAQLASSGNISELEIKYKQPKPLKRYANFHSSSPYNLSQTRQHELNKNWVQKLHLDQQLFYRLRFSDKAIHQEYISFQQDSFYQNIAQFAPYIIEKGKSVPIFMIYCNRKLIYYYEADNDTPYSFIGKKGYNSIVLRTRNYEYQIDSVLLKKGQKLEFAINTRSLSKNRNITKRIRPDSLLATERKLLKDRMFFLRQKESTPEGYLWQDTFSIQYTNTVKNQSYYYERPKPLMFGPFSKQENIRFLQPNRIGTQFLFEPSFEYEIEAGRERLYASTHFDKRMPLPKTLPYKMPLDSLIQPKRLKYKKQVPLDGTSLSRTFKNVIHKGGSFQFAFQDSLHSLAAIAIKNDSSLQLEQFVPMVKYFSKLAPSSYTLLLVNQDFETYQYRFEIKSDSLLFIKINHPKWEKIGRDSFQIWFPPNRVAPKTPFISLEDKVLPFDLINGNEIRGQVSDSDGEALIGASIYIKGTNIGTITDIDGYYSIIIPEEIEIPTLVITYTGFATQEYAISSGEIANFNLQEGVHLDEVVVTGYGISKSIRTLQAKVAGVSINEKKGRVYENARYSLSDSSEDNESGERNENTGYYIDGIYIQPDSTVPDNTTQGSALSLNALNTILNKTSSIRSNFQDYAYWNPNLVTDQNGEAYFTVTYPDNITSWNTFVVGMDRKLRAGVAYGNTKSYKPLLAQLATPRFLVEGDESDLVGKAVNYTNDTLAIETKFELEGKAIQNKSTDLVDGFVEKIKVNTPFQADSLHFQYQLAMDDYFDGEKRAIPVIRKGVESVKGTFLVLDRDTNLTIVPQVQESDMQVTIEGNLLPSILRSLDYLNDYPYGCNEQTASRLWALLMKKKVYEKLGKGFEQEAKIKKMLARLEKAQNKDGSWGWWTGNTANVQMSVYVTKVLQAAAEENYPTAALKKGLDYLALNLKKQNQRLKIDALMVLAKSNVPYNFEDALIYYDSSEVSIYERLASIRIRQILNQDYSLDSLYHHQKRNTYASVYWQQDFSYWYDRSNQPTILAYEILKAAGKKSELKAIRQWFLQQRGRYINSAWTNTYQTATILATILPEILETAAPKDLEREVVKINGDTIRQFPYVATFASNTSIQLEKEGKSPLFFTAYQRYFESQPKRQDSLFDITSTLYQAGKKVKQLEQGKRVQLKVEVKVKASADYVMIEIPIPAACSYHSKANGWQFPEVHREYFKEKTAIFCRKLKAGKYEFELDLEARFSGNYTLNPVRVEQMYFPVFDGNNELKEVRVR